MMRRWTENMVSILSAQLRTEQLGDANIGSEAARFQSSPPN